MTQLEMISPYDGSVVRRDYDSRGRVDMALLKQVLPFDDYGFFICCFSMSRYSLYLEKRLHTGP